MDDASLRASDADRERAVEALREHLLAGRLTLEEFCERVDTALTARVTGDLVRVQQDLPVAFVGSCRAGRKPARFTAAVLGHVVRRGRVRLAHGRSLPARSRTWTSTCETPAWTGSGRR